MLEDLFINMLFLWGKRLPILEKVHNKMFGNTAYGPVGITDCHLNGTKSLYGLTLPKLQTALKKASNKSWWKLNLLQKTQWARTFIFPRNGASELHRLPRFKYYNVLKQENRFILGLDTAKITDYIEKCFKQQLLKIKFPTKTH